MNITCSPLTQAPALLVENYEDTRLARKDTGSRAANKNFTGDFRNLLWSMDTGRGE
jgi:hypothetical protein